MCVTKGMIPYWMGVRRLWAQGIIVLICCLFFSGKAYAHRVMIFGWVEGDRIITQSKFSSKRVVQGGDVSVFDMSGNRILSGKTDAQGEFAFQIPVRETLKIVLSAGTAHQAEWTISGAELGAGSERLTVVKGDAQPVTTVRAGEGGCQQDAMVALIEKALDKKLHPVLQYVAESKEQPVSLRDILGGIGYIIGLVGLAAYMRFRSAKKQES